MEHKNEIICDTSYNNMYDMLKDCISEVQANAKNKYLSGISTGFSNLDKLTCGFEPGKVYIIGARPAMGKMAFMLSMIRGITLESRVPVLLFSTNHMKSDYIYRLLSIQCDIPTSQLHKGWLKPHEWDHLDKRTPSLLNVPLFIHDSLDLPLEELVETARQCIKEKGIKIIFVDCLQMIDFSNADGNTSERIGKVMSALKELAYETNLPVVVGAMLNRGIEHREGLEGKRPQLMDLAYSNYIEELADVVMMVHRPEYYMIFEDIHGRKFRGKMEIIVMKNALRPLDSVTLDYHQETGLVCMRGTANASEPVRLKDFRTSNKAVKSLIKSFDLEEDMPF